MGKTVRRKTLKNNGYYDKTSRTARAYVDPSDVADNIFHSDKPKRWKGIDSEVKTAQAKLSRTDKRHILNKVLENPEYDTLRTDLVYKKKSNEAYAYS